MREREVVLYMFVENNGKGGEGEGEGRVCFMYVKGMGCAMWWVRERGLFQICLG